MEKHHVIEFTANNARIHITPDPEAFRDRPGFYIDPDLSHVSTTPPHFWKVYEGVILPMSDLEKKERIAHMSEYGVDQGEKSQSPHALQVASLQGVENRMTMLDQELQILEKRVFHEAERMHQAIYEVALDSQEQMKQHWDLRIDQEKTIFMKRVRIILGFILVLLIYLAVRMGGFHVGRI
jgi:hypothetical protein